MRHSIPFGIIPALFALGMILLGGCFYDQILEDLPTDTEVSFSQDILPAFEQQCSYSGCHNVGGEPPDLTTANAYDALHSGGYIDTEDPEASELYQWMLGNRATPMPITGADASLNAQVLAWLQQGALDN